MFTRMQKYHKAFLIFVTVLIAASFGMGSLFMSLADRGDITKVVTLGHDPNDPQTQNIPQDQRIPFVQISQNEYTQAREQWQHIFQLAKLLSIRAQRIQKVRQGDDFKNFQALFYAPDNVWDLIFSLREDVAKIDQKIDENLSQPMRWQALMEGKLDFLGSSTYPPKMDELDYYYTMSDEDRQEIESSLPESDILKFLVMELDAKRWGISVAESEVKDFVTATKALFGSDSIFQERLNNLRISSNAFEKMITRALTVVKYVQAREIGLKIPTQQIYDNYSRYHSIYQLQYTKADVKDFMPKEEEYTKIRDEFFASKSQENPSYFKLPATANFDYISFPANAFVADVKVSEEEVTKVFTERDIQIDDDLDDETYNARVAEEKGKIEDELRLQKSERKALLWLSELRNNIVALGNEAPLAKIAEQYKMKYQLRQNIEESDFFQAEAKPAPFNAQKYLYKDAKEGNFSDVLSEGAGKDKLFYIFRLIKKQDAKTITKQDIDENDSYFLQCYFEQNRKAFEMPERYRLAYVMTDYNQIEKNLLITSKAMKDFYEMYKDKLYKNEEVKEGESQYRSFKDVQEDVRARVAHSLRTKELQKIQLVHRLCKDKGQDVNLELIAKEAARQIMLAPDGLIYLEDAELASREDIIKNNLVHDPAFDSFNANEEISAVKDSPNGKYFYRVIEKAEATKANFSMMKEKVREHFMKSQAQLKAQVALAAWKEQYDFQMEECKRRNNNATSMANKIFRTIATEKNANVVLTPTFSNISDIEELAKVNEISTALAMTAGELSKPLVDGNTIYLVQLVSKREPKLEEIPVETFEKIRSTLTQRFCRANKMSLLDHEKYYKDMNVQALSDYNGSAFDNDNE